jgi:MATE family multidrug resistance protein
LFLRWLTSDAAVVALAADYLPWVWVIPFAGMTAFTWDGIFIGITATRGMFISCLVASVAFFLIFFLCFPALQNHALWLAFIVYLLLRGLVQTCQKPVFL